MKSDYVRGVVDAVEYMKSAQANDFKHLEPVSKDMIDYLIKARKEEEKREAKRIGRGGLKGALIGVAPGAIIGGLAAKGIGNNTRGGYGIPLASTRDGALTGALLGAFTGGAIGGAREYFKD